MSRDAFQRSLFLPSGGLVWHARALRFRSGWKDYMLALANWLQSWQHDRKDLLLLGPSAGWCLDPRWLTPYRTLVAVDLDPLAPVLFRLRHGLEMHKHQVRMQWHAIDALENLEMLLHRHPSHAVLFCNLLGQHIVHSKSVERTMTVLGRLKHQLRGRAWASFHDCLSRPWTRAESWPSAFVLEGNHGSLDIAERAGVSGTWEEHLTTDVFPAGVRKHYFPWLITSSRMHIIEAGAVGG